MFALPKYWSVSCRILSVVIWLSSKVISFFLFNTDMKISLNVMFSKVSKTLFSFHDLGRKTFLVLKNTYCLLNGFIKEA